MQAFILFLVFLSGLVPHGLPFVDLGPPAGCRGASGGSQGLLELPQEIVLVPE